MPKVNHSAMVELSKNEVAKILRKWIFTPEAADQCPRPSGGENSIEVDLSEDGATITYQPQA